LPYENATQFIYSFHRLFEIAPVEIQLGILKGLPGTLLFLQSKALDMHFDSKPPYTIQHTPWMSESDLQRMEWAALGVEKTYNRPIGKTLSTIVYQQNKNVFDYFCDVGTMISRLKHPYQLSDVVQIMISSSEAMLSYETSIAAIGSDMGRWHKSKPKGLPYVEHDKEQLQRMMLDIESRSNHHQDQWRSNSWVYPAIVNEEVGYQWIVYPLATRYYYDKGANYVNEETHFTSNK
jgi:hypothetical protein